MGCALNKTSFAKRGSFKRGGFPIWTGPSFFVLFGTFFPIFLGFSRFARGWSGDFPDLSFSSFSAYFKSTYEEQSQKGPRHNLDLSRKKWETPRFSFSQNKTSLCIVLEGGGGGMVPGGRNTWTKFPEILGRSSANVVFVLSSSEAYPPLVVFSEVNTDSFRAQLRFSSHVLSQNNLYTHAKQILKPTCRNNEPS